MSSLHKGKLTWKQRKKYCYERSYIQQKVIFTKLVVFLRMKLEENCTRPEVS